MLRAVKEGADVRGFYYWTLNDNFEWNVGARRGRTWTPAPVLPLRVVACRRRASAAPLTGARAGQGPRGLLLRGHGC